MEPEADGNGTKRWYDERGQLHRDGGPAVEGKYGDCFWYQRGRLHRDGGPAVEWADGHCEWYQRGQLHRDKGPAIVNADGFCSWYWHGKYVSEAEHAALRQRTGLAVLALDGARRRKRRAVHLPAELWDALAEW